MSDRGQPPLALPIAGPIIAWLQLGLVVLAVAVLLALVGVSGPLRLLAASILAIVLSIAVRQLRHRWPRLILRLHHGGEVELVSATGDTAWPATLRSPVRRMGPITLIDLECALPIHRPILLLRPCLGHLQWRALQAWSACCARPVA